MASYQTQLVFAFGATATLPVLTLGLIALVGGEPVSPALVWVAAVGMCGALVVALYFAGAFGKPLETVVAATRAVTANDYRTRVPETGPDEIALMARALNQLVEEVARKDSDLRRHAEDLEAAVEARTTELARQNAALEEANRRLAEADKFKSAFLANMSHELRTPLNAIIGYTELTLEGAFGPVTEKQQKRLSTVHGSARHLLNLINEVLDISKVAAGKLELRPEELDVDALLKETQEIVHPLAVKKGVTLEFQPSPVPTLHVDRVRLKQCLLNYLSNAVKFTPEGGRVTLRVTREGEHATFRVRDTGPGITAADREKLFREFHQLDNSLTRKHGGTGLGLALTKKLTELMGGVVGVDSTPGEGSEFWLTVPCPEPSAAPAEVPPLPATPEEGVILVVDDDAAWGETMTAAFAAAGHHVATAANADAALAILHAGHVRAVVLDVILPGSMDGWELFRRMRKEAALRMVPVVFVSQVHGRDFALPLGAAEFLVKPVEPPAVVGAVETALANPQRPVLVVDADPQLRQTLRAELEAAGYRVAVAASGEEALEAVARELPAAMVVDLVMPGMSGLDLIDRIRSDDRLFATPILVLTAKDLTDEERRLLVLQVDAIYPKGETVYEPLVRELALRSSQFAGGIPA